MDVTGKGNIIEHLELLNSIRDIQEKIQDFAFVCKVYTELI